MLCMCGSHCILHMSGSMQTKTADRSINASTCMICFQVRYRKLVPWSSRSGNAPDDATVVNMRSSANLTRECFDHVHIWPFIVNPRFSRRDSYSAICCKNTTRLNTRYADLHAVCEQLYSEYKYRINCVD
jgi:hypothetical protein